jgi:hypothetical protein
MDAGPRRAGAELIQVSVGPGERFALFAPLAALVSAAWGDVGETSVEEGRTLESVIVTATRIEVRWMSPRPCP